MLFYNFNCFTTGMQEVQLDFERVMAELIFEANLSKVCVHRLDHTVFVAVQF